MNIRRLTFFILTMLLIIVPVLSQESSVRKMYPVIYGKKGDGFPQRLKARGVIVDVSLVPSACGLVRYSGTLKLKLQDKVEGYNQDHVYVVVPCLIDLKGEEKFLNKTICISVTKMDGKGRWGKTCYADHVINRIDSQRTPFYCLAVNGEHLLEKVECGAQQ